MLAALHAQPGDRVLDVGSPKFAAVFLADVQRCIVHATDISDYFVPQLTFFSQLQGLDAGPRGGALRLEIEDGRRLSYPAETFDKVYTVSVLEHIPGDGDTAAIRECARVLKPGGRLVVTTNISNVHRDVMLVPRRYPEHFMPDLVSDRDQPTFFERRYDRRSLEQRLIEASGLRLVQDLFFVERYRYHERLLSRLRFRLKVPLFPLSILLARACLRREPVAARAFQETFAVALLTLEKQ
jgi:SAM-dependent methyltransferase